MMNARNAFYMASLGLAITNRLLVIYSNYQQHKQRDYMNEHMFDDLTFDQEIKFRAWARDNYKPFSQIKTTWHPVVQHECATINLERMDNKRPKNETHRTTF